MTDQQILFGYRLKQAEETLSDAEKMLESHLTPRSIANRAYYSMFYAVLALFLKQNFIKRPTISIYKKRFYKNSSTGVSPVLTSETLVLPKFL